MAAIPHFWLHGECDFSCCALASNVLPALFPPAGSMAHPLPQFLHHVQPQKALVDLKQCLTLLASRMEVCRETAQLFILVVLLAFGD